MFERWFLLAVAAGLFSTLFNTINRTHLKDNKDSTSYSWWFESLRAVFFAILLFFNFRLDLTVEHLGILVLLGITEFIAVYFFMKMHTSISLSVSSVFTQFRVVLVPVLAFFVIGERLNVYTYLGIVLLLSGLLLTLSKIEINKMGKGVQYAILFSVVSALSSVLTKQASSFASVPVVMLAFSLPSVFAFPIMMKQPFERLATFAQSHVKTIVYAACANIMTLLLLGNAYTVGTVSQITAVFLSMFICNVLVGTVFLGERFSLRQITGVSIVLISIFLIQ